MTARVDAALTVATPPLSLAADPKHLTGVICRVAHSATSALATAADIPKEMRGRYCSALAIGANVDFGVLVADANGNTPSAPTLTYGALSATGTGSTAAAPETAIDGVEKPFYMPSNARRIVYVSASAAAGTFKVSLSGDQTGTGK